MEQIHHPDGSTLGDLRRLLASVESLPDTAEVRVRTRATWSADGGPITRVHLETVEAER